MSDAKVLLGIAIMFLATWLPRTVPLILMSKQITNRYVLAFLNYTPFAVLAALTFPSVFSSTQTLVGALAGLAVASFTAYFNKNLVTIALVGAIAVLAVESFFG